MNQDNKSSVRILQNSQPRKKTKNRFFIWIYLVLAIFIITTFTFVLFYINNSQNASLDISLEDKTKNMPELNQDNLNKTTQHFDNIEQTQNTIKIKDNDFNHIFKHHQQKNTSERDTPFEQIIKLSIHKNPKASEIIKNNMPKNQQIDNKQNSIKQTSVIGKDKPTKDSALDESPEGSVQISIIRKNKEE